MYRITKKFKFCAAHHLEDFSGHCARNHGHNFLVELTLQSATLSGPGFVREFDDLKQFGAVLDERFDHRDLNEVMAVNPTTENIAAALYDIAKVMFPETVCVRVWENDNNSAAFGEF